MWAGLGHRGTGRLLVHRLKYEGLIRAADVLAAAMAPLVPETATALVPVPRAMMRRWAHGIDPAQVLAGHLSKRCGLPVVEGLRPAVWWPRHAARGDRARSRARFRAVRSADPAWVLVDDVATSGATLDAASHALRGVVRLALVATSPSRVTGVGLQQRSPMLGDRGRRCHPLRDGGRIPTLPFEARSHITERGNLAAPEMVSRDR